VLLFTPYSAHSNGTRPLQVTFGEKAYAQVADKCWCMPCSGVHSTVWTVTSKRPIT